MITSSLNKESTAVSEAIAESSLSVDGTGDMTEERVMIQEVARDFTMNEVLPVANELDPVQGQIPMALRDKLAQMGYFGILVPEEYGGLGLGCFEYCLIAEELARGWMSVGSLIARGNGMFGASHMSE
ncbi:MAG: acyl-CoA dehydrogenase family protein, partial [Gammaproteobacteria bacterium]|nr:acyl-CoA dehydrogenase family protein [Gammaproteobacteria bacterium]